MKEADPWRVEVVIEKLRAKYVLTLIEDDKKQIYYLGSADNEANCLRP